MSLKEIEMGEVDDKIVNDNGSKVEFPEDIQGDEAQAERREVRETLVMSQKRMSRKDYLGSFITNVTQKTTKENIANVFCALNGTGNFCLTLALTAVMYWKYNELHPVGTHDYAYCLVVLLFIDLAVSITGPYFIANYGYGPVSVCWSVCRILFVSIFSLYFTENYRPPHTWFTFFCGGSVMVCPTFMISATALDSWLIVSAPELRIIGNMIPILYAGTWYGFGYIYIVFIDDNFTSTMVTIFFLAMCTGLEAYLLWNGAFKCDIETITMSDFVGKMMSFFTTELVIKAFAADGILASMWVVFGWYIPIFQAGTEASIDEIAIRTLICGIPVMFAAVMAYCCYIVSVTWGITNEIKLLQSLMRHHLMSSWLSKTLCVVALYQSWRWNKTLHMVIVSVSLGINMVTPNSIIMILSVPEDCAVAYSGFAQVSFIGIVYGANLGMNYYGGSFENANFSVGYAVIFTITSLGCLIPLSLWTLYEGKFMDRKKSFKSKWMRSHSAVQASIEVKQGKQELF